MVLNMSEKHFEVHYKNLHSGVCGRDRDVLLLIVPDVSLKEVFLISFIVFKGKMLKD